MCRLIVRIVIAVGIVVLIGVVVARFADTESELLVVMNGQQEVYLIDVERKTQFNLNPAHRDYQMTLWQTSLEPGWFEINTQSSQMTLRPLEAMTPCWSPDGQHIAVVSRRDRNQEIYLIDPNSGRLTNVTQNAADDTEPAWSPDGRWLAFTSSRMGNWDIFVLDMRTGSLRQMTQHPASDTQAGWLPDGEQLTFVSQRDGEPVVYVTNLSSGREIRYETAAR